MDLGARPSPVMVDAQPEYEIDCTLCEHITGNKRCFLIRFRGWDDSEAQWMSKAELKNAPALLAEWE